LELSRHSETRAAREGENEINFFNFSLTVMATWAQHLFSETNAVENDGLVRKATRGQHAILAKGGQLGVVGEEAETQEQRASLDEMAGNVALSAVKDCVPGEFIISPQGGTNPSGVMSTVQGHPECLVHPVEHFHDPNHGDGAVQAGGVQQAL
jgi:hypothetical protein